jgi:hypothetical protein
MPSPRYITEIFSQEKPTVAKMPDGEWYISIPTTHVRIQFTDLEHEPSAE